MKVRREEERVECLERTGKDNRGCRYHKTGVGQVWGGGGRGVERGDAHGDGIGQVLVEKCV